MLAVVNLPVSYVDGSWLPKFIFALAILTPIYYVISIPLVILPVIPSLFDSVFFHSSPSDNSPICLYKSNESLWMYYGILLFVASLALLYLAAEFFRTLASVRTSFPIESESSTDIGTFTSNPKDLLSNSRFLVTESRRIHDEHID
jgi:hypothetical protein